MDDNFSYFYSRILDLSAAGSIATKPLCIYIIITRTPKYMRTVSYFILNELLWNTIGNAFYTLAHPLPMMPATCFRMDGVIAHLLTTEEHRCIYFIAIVVTVLNCCLGFVTTFAFRYVTLAFHSTISNIHTVWAYVLCTLFHLITSIVVVVLFLMWRLPISEYPQGDLPESTSNLFCFHPQGVEINIVAAVFLVYFFASTLIVFVLAGLTLRELRIQKHLMERRTAFLQRAMLKNLTIITGNALLLGGLPLSVVVFYIYNGHLPYARKITSGLFLITLNFGTLYAILILCLFKAYRRAVANIVKSLLKLLESVVGAGQSSNIISSNSAPYVVNNVRY
uniref:G_PROTEIN_RECEP_F1_2 domain-containing protein n=1 Tax=Steinernema glaseri TaxID=37863 RepID=A0A1I8AMB1_9BILA